MAIGHARKAAATLVVGFVLALVWGSDVASAELADGSTVTVAPSTVQRGDAFTISGDGCTGDEAAGVVEINDEFVDAVSADEEGEWTVETEVPADADAGTYVVQAYCDTYDETAEYPPASVTVAETPPPAPVAKAAVGAASVAAGGTVDVSGTDFLPGESVTVTLRSDPVLLRTLTASSLGTVGATVTVPAGTPAGAHTIELRGTTSGRTATVALTVTAAAKASTSLPKTGSPTSWMARAAASLLLCGVGTMLIAAGRRQLFL